MLANVLGSSDAETSCPRSSPAITVALRRTVASQQPLEKKLFGATCRRELLLSSISQSYRLPRPGSQLPDHPGYEEVISVAYVLVDCTVTMFNTLQSSIRADIASGNAIQWEMVYNVST